MTQVTVRQIEEAWVEKAKSLAKEKGVSMNAVLRKAIMEGLGVDEERKKNGLEGMGGSMPEGFGPEFDKAMEECSRIDWEEWK